MTTLLIVFITAAVLVAVALGVVFTRDARRADAVAQDTDRLATDSHDPEPDPTRRTD
ncbi:MAG: hypothetical protein U0R80_09665 [Nocardioidaceae bacterium]